ncbi:PKD domain-containing protein [Halodesulfovibrio aestuarii]|uniref:PKD domain-containing protein n=1 Tax=Halodesulfovibrio aestuarii TaxID=126333 RepID=UPI003D338447
MLFFRMALLFFCVVPFLLPASAHAGGSANFWLYGQALFSFHDDGTKTVTSSSPMELASGASSFSIAEEDGTPLFVGSGTVVYKVNEGGTPLQLTSSLNSSATVSQTAAFLPDSTVVNRLYLIYLDGATGLKYSTLDASKETVEEIWVQQDVAIAGTHDSKAITIADHANKKDVWIISLTSSPYTGPEDTPQGFEAVLFDGTSFTRKDIIAPNVAKPIAIYSNFQLSPDGKKLVYGYEQDSKIGFVEYDFNNETGNITYNRTVEMPATSTTLNGGGIAFSADGRYLYMGGGTYSGLPEFFQLDLQNSEAIPVSMTVPELGANKQIGGGQLAPDGNIYYCISFEGIASIINSDKAYDGTESGAHLSIISEEAVGSAKPGLPLFNQSLLLTKAVIIKRENSNLQLEVDTSKLPAGTLDSYGICWTDSGTPTIADSKLSATDPAAPPVWDMNDYLTAGTSYTIRAFATVDGTTYYYDEMQMTLSVPPTVDTSATNTSSSEGALVSLKVVPVEGCSYLWEQESGPTVTISNVNSANASFTMPDADVGVKITLVTADGTSASQSLVINLGPPAVIETPADVSNGGSVSLVAQAVDGATYLWEQTAGTPTVTITNSDAREAQFDATSIADGTSLTFKLTVTKDGVSSVVSKVITVHTPPPVDISATKTSSPEGEVVSLKVVPVEGCTYLWEQESGTEVTISNADSANASFTMPASDVGVKITLVSADGISASKSLVVALGPPAVIETPADVSNGGSVSLIAQSVEGATYLWEQTGGTPTVTITNSDAREAQFDATSIADGTSLTFKLTVTKDGRSTVVTKVITVRTPPAITFVDIPSQAKAGVTVNLKVQPVDGVTYEWAQTAGISVSISNATTANASFTMPDGAGVMTFEITLTDAYGIKSAKSVSIKRDAPPVANAGPDQNVTEGDTVTLSGAGSSDPMGETLTYAWTQTSGTEVTLKKVTDSTYTFVAPVVPAAGESLVFQLKVTDPGGQSDTDDVTINVTYLNDPPVANAGPNQNVKTGDKVTLSGINSYDPDEGALTYKWEQTGGETVTLTDDTDVKPRFTAPDVTGALQFKLTVTDSGGLTSDDSVICNISTSSSTKIAPIAEAGADYTVECGSSVTLNGLNSHARGDDYLVGYLWEVQSDSSKSVTLSNSTAACTSFTAPSSAARIVFKLTVRAQSGLEDTDTVVINVTDAGTPPVANAGSDQSVSNGAVGVVLDASGSTAPGSSIVSYWWEQTSGLPVALSDIRASNPTFDAPSLASGCEALAFRLSVTNAEGMTDSDTVIVNVDSDGALLMPTAVPTSNVGAGKSVEGATVILDASASSASGTATLTSYSWTQVAGPMAPLSNPSAIAPTFVCPSTEVETTLVFELTVTDSNDMESTGRTSVVYTPNTFADIDTNQIQFTAYDGVQHLGIAPKEAGAGTGFTSGAIVTLKAVDPASVSGTGTAPTEMTYGLIDFRVRVEKPGDSTEVTVELPSAAPANWVKLDGSGAWVDYTEHVSYNAKRTIATIKLTDGGIGDADGIANGIIVDPSGPGVMTSPSPTPSPSSSGGGSGGGCTMTLSTPFHVDLLMILCGWAGLIFYRRKRKKTVR